MGNAHRAGGPEYNPNTGMHVNVEHTSNPLERSLRVKPEDEHVKGVNFPYRGAEQHGLPYHDTIPDGLEGTPSHEDLELVLPPHYAPRPHEPAPVPVRVVEAGVNERLPWMADQFNVSDTVPIMAVGRQDNREHVIIRNMDALNNVYVGPSPDVKAVTGMQIPPGTTHPRFKTTEAIYAITESGKTAQISVMWEYRVKA